MRGGAALRDFVLKATSLPLEKACRLLVVVVAAPTLGVAAFGAYQFDVTVTAFLASATELGLGIWTTRALAARRDAAAPIVAAGLRFRTWTGGWLLVLVASVALTLGPGESRATLLVFGGAALASSFVDYAAAALRGCGDFRREALVNATRAIASAALALAALRFWRTLGALAAALTCGAALGALLGLVLLRGAVAAASAEEPEGAPAPRIVVGEVLPLWLTGFLSSLYFRGDILLLRYLTDDRQVGAYGAAYRVLEALTIFPAAVMAVAFPRLVQRRAAGRLSAAVEVRLVVFLFAVGLFAAAALRVGGDRLFLAVFGGDFEIALPSLRVLAWAAPVLFANFGLTQLLFVRGQERAYLGIVVGLLVINVGTNLFAIPALGGPGAAWATVATELVSAASAMTVLATTRPKALLSRSAG